MRAAVEEKKKMAESTKKEKEILPHEYGCQILVKLICLICTMINMVLVQFKELILDMEE